MLGESDEQIREIPGLMKFSSTVGIYTIKMLNILYSTLREIVTMKNKVHGGILGFKLAILK